MTELRYEAPESLSAAVLLLTEASGVSRVLAGGTDVIVQMEMDLIGPELLVEIKKIPEVPGISAENGGFGFGAATTGMQICDHKACAAWPWVIEGMKLIGSIQVKGRASIDANLCNASPWAKEGCAPGDCGACSVTVDGVLQCACLMLGVEANGFHVETIEGMAKGADLHPLQKAFLLHNGLQCGICTPDLPWLCAGLNQPFMPLLFRTAWL